MRVTSQLHSENLQAARWNYIRPTDRACWHEKEQLTLGGRRCWNLHGNKEIAGEDKIVKMAEWHRGMKVVGRDPSIRIGPLPGERRLGWNRLLKIV